MWISMTWEMCGTFVLKWVKAFEDLIFLEHGLERMWVPKYLLPCFIWFVCWCSNSFWFPKANLTVIIISISLLSLQFLLLHYKSWLLLSWLFTCSLSGTDFCCCCSNTKIAWLCPTCLVCDVRYICFSKVLLCSPDIRKSFAFERKKKSSLITDSIRIPKSKNRITVCTSHCLCVYI